MDQPNEKELIERSQKDPKHFKDLYEIYYPKILNYMRFKVIGDTQTAQDLTSVTFEKALKSIKSYKWQGISFNAWIFRIANNTVIDFYRTNSKKTVNTDKQNELKDDEDLEARIEKYDTATRMQSFLKELKAPERDIVTLKFYEGLTNKEISKILNITETNTSTILNRTMKKLRILWLRSGKIDV